MARNNTGIFTEIFAENGDKAAPPFTIPTGWDSDYSTPVGSGGQLPSRLTFNYLLNQLYAIGVDVNRYGGALIWDATINYVIGAVISASDGNIYVALTNNINSNPVSNPLDWSLLVAEKNLANEVATMEGTRLVGHTGETLYAYLNGLTEIKETCFASYTGADAAGNVPIISNRKGITSIISAGAGLTLHWNIIFDHTYATIPSVSITPSDTNAHSTSAFNLTTTTSNCNLFLLSANVGVLNGFTIDVKGTIA